MGLRIVRGKQAAPAKVVLYGGEGIGKTTLASQFPDPLILDTEDGTNQLDVARVVVGDWQTMRTAVAALAVDRQGFSTLVVDSIDWAERLLVEWVCKDNGKDSVEAFGFGKGWVMVAEQMGKFLDSLDNLVRAGMNVVLVGHSTVKRVSPPEMTEGYDRHELKLSKQVSPLVKEWADAVIFLNYRTRVVEGNDGRAKAVGGKERFMFADRSAAFDAKNRYGLPAEMPMNIAALAPMFAGAKPAEPPLFDRIADYIKKAATVRTLGTIGDKVDGYLSTGELTAAQEQLLRDAINERHAELEPQEVSDGVA